MEDKIMTICSLTLHPYGKQLFSVGLLENNTQNSNVDQIITKEPDAYIFSDLSYEFILSRGEISSIKNVDIYINDVYEPSVYNNGHILFPHKSASDRRIFLDCYGFVKITLVVHDTDDIEHQYSTEYLPVLVRRGELNGAVKAMMSYIYSHFEFLLLNGEPQARDLATLKDCGHKNLAAQIILAEEIAIFYENSYGYFKANSRFRIEKAQKIDRFDRLQYVTPTTVQFIATHPEQLRQANGNSGIRIGNRIYQPEKTLSLQNKRSYNIYENRIILGFIKKMLDSINELYANCQSLLEQIPSQENYGSEYIYSSFFMFMQTKKMLENDLSRLASLRTKFTRFWAVYNEIFNIKPEVIEREPRPSRVFLSIPQYNHIFIKIHKWFQFGIYDFSKENFMLSLIKISSLYEGYVLAKMITYFQNRGYTLQTAKKCVYPTRRNWKYRNTNCNNTFVFKNDHSTLTLYYQPVIYDTDKSGINGVSLVRNNSIPVFSGDDDNRAGGHYYSPDYLIKIQDNSISRYLILDAKFSDYMCIRQHHIRNLAFKYLFSISPIGPTESIVGLCLVYGKCTPSEQLRSAYDKCLPGQKIMPVAEILPLVEGVANETHYSKLDALMKLITS